MIRETRTTGQTPSHSSKKTACFHKKSDYNLIKKKPFF